MGFRVLGFRVWIINIIIIKGHSLRRACLQPATNMQNSKPRPPTMNARSRGQLENKIKHCSKLSTGYHGYWLVYFYHKVVYHIKLRAECIDISVVHKGPVSGGGRCWRDCSEWDRG